MAEGEHVIGGLIRKRAELAGEIAHADDVLRCLVADLAHVDATLRLFDPSINLDEIRPRRFRPGLPAKASGVLIRPIFSALRKAKGPLSARALALYVMDFRGMDTEDRQLVLTVTRRVSVSLQAQREKGVLVARKGQDGVMLWGLAQKRK